jgi:CarD family transcriptional regulator
MEFAVGDQVVHPHHGPGRVAGIERKDLMHGIKRYYVIDIPSQALTLQVPVRRIGDSGVRLAMSPSRLPKVLRTLRSKPRRLPGDYKERQEQIEAEIRTGRVMKLARVVRDLNWHRHRAHLTRRDTDLLKQALDQLAAEIALVSDKDVPEASELIESTIAAAIAGPSAGAKPAARAGTEPAAVEPVRPPQGPGGLLPKRHPQTP